MTHTIQDIRGLFVLPDGGLGFFTVLVANADLVLHGVLVNRTYTPVTPRQ